MGIESSREVSTVLSNLQAGDSMQRIQVISLRDLHDIPQHVSVITAIFRRAGYIQMMTDAAAACCAVLM